MDKIARIYTDSPEDIIQRIQDFCDMHADKFPRQIGVEYSFAHIVLDDYNLADSHILHCLSSADLMMDWIARYKDDNQTIIDRIDIANNICWFLRLLLEFPEANRLAAMEYIGTHD